MTGNTGLMRFKLADGTEVVFETDLPAEGGEELMNRNEGEIPEAKERFDVLLQRIRPVAQTVLDALKELNTPQEIHLEFGVKLGGKAGIVFASAESECNFKVGLKWTNPPRTA
jgi:hypothetical protein